VNFTDRAGLYRDGTERESFCDVQPGGPGCQMFDALLGASHLLAVDTWTAEPIDADYQIMIDAAMRASDRVFREKCGGLFAGGDANSLEQRRALSEGLQQAADEGDLRLISRDALPAATPPDIPAFTQGGFIYTVSGGSFFTNLLNGKPLGGAFQGLLQGQTQELMIIHEMLHWLGLVGADNKQQQITLPNGQTVTGSDGVSDAVRKACFDD
jgi:hypothetical protein